MIALFLFAAAPSAGLAVDCSSHFNVSAEEAYKLKSVDIQACVHQGWDPPAAWLPNMSAGISGTNAGGSGGFSAGTMQAPEMPPFAAGANKTGSGSICFAYGGYSICGNIKINDGQLAKKDKNTAPSATNPAAATPTMIASGDGSAATIDEDGNVTLPADVCPITSGDALKVTNVTTQQNYYGVFGSNTWFTSTQPVALSCGGAVPLNNFQLTLVQNPTGLARIEHWVPYIWLYKANVKNYQQINDKGAVTDQPVRLPKYLCEEYEEYGETKRRKSSNPLPSYLPTGQMITYNGNTKIIALQLMMQPTTTGSDLFAPASPNALYLKLPIINGVPYVPKDGIRPDGSKDWDECDLQEDYVKSYAQLKNNSNLSADIVIHSTMQARCTISKEICGSLGALTPPSTPANCETHALFPESSTETVSCEGRVQHFGLDHPNLYFSPGTYVSAKPFVDRKGAQWPKFPNAKKTGDPTVDFYMVSTNTNSTKNSSRLMTTSDATIQLGRSNNVFVFPNGATIAAANSDRIMIRPPAHIDMKNLLLTMPNGGVKNTKAGAPNGTFGKGASYDLSALPLPLTIKVSRDMNMPPNYVIPTQSSALVREPAPAAD
jgi:hypothetical protein